MIHRMLHMLSRASFPGGGKVYDYGKTVPTDGASGYGTGCLFAHTDGAATTALYVNVGTLASCNFDAIGTILDDGTVTAAKLAAAVQDVIPALTVAGVDGTDGTATVTVTVKDAAGNALAGRFLIRVWIGEADDFGADAQTAVTVSTGTSKAVVTDKAEYLLVTHTDGTAVLDVDHNAAGSIYVWAELAGKVYASGAIVITSV